MSAPSTDGKQFANLAYHSAVVSGLAMGYAALGKKIMKDFTPYDAGMVVLDVGLAMVTKDMLVKQGILPAEILK